MENVKVVIVFRSNVDDPNCSHAGLGICAINTMKTLNQHGIKAYIWPVVKAETIDLKLAADKSITHVVIQAPWINSNFLYSLVTKYPDVQFAVNCHSNVGFLQTEPQAMTKMIDLLEMEQASQNLHCSGNSLPFRNWIESAYQSYCTYLPNLYYVDDVAETHRPLWNGGLLRIGSFGATRPQKNVMTNVAGAIQIAQLLKAHTEIWLNAGRTETHGRTILEACRRAIARNPYCTLKLLPWCPWPEFRRFVGSMNLLLQCSYTESFNQVTADGIAMGVPSVVSTAIRWVPRYWEADSDDAESIARVGRHLLNYPTAAREGLQDLRKWNHQGVHEWKKYLSGAPFKLPHPY